MRAAISATLRVDEAGRREASPAGDAGLEASAVAPTDGAPGPGEGSTIAAEGGDAGCYPVQVSGWSPVPVVPEILGACSGAQIQAIVQNCLAGSTSTCSQLLSDAANQSCVGCVYTPYSASPIQQGVNPVAAPGEAWGPLIEVQASNMGGLQFPNVGAWCWLTCRRASAQSRSRRSSSAIESCAAKLRAA